MKNLGLSWNRRTALRALIFVLASALTTRGQAPGGIADYDPVALDDMMALAGTPISKSDFSARFKDRSLPPFSGINLTTDLRFSRATGRPFTLFGIAGETAHFWFGPMDIAKPLGLSVAFVDHRSSEEMTRSQFDQKLKEVTAAVTKYTGAPPAKDIEPSEVLPAGSRETHRVRWTNPRGLLTYSFNPEDRSRQIPFRAGYICFDF